MNLHSTAFTPEDTLIAYLRARYTSYEWVPSVDGGYDYRVPATAGLRPSAWLHMNPDTVTTTDMRTRSERWLREGRPARPSA
jgi:hypothetical protein